MGFEGNNQNETFIVKSNYLILLDSTTIFPSLDPFCMQ